MIKALGIFSGGLDSILSVRILQEQDIDVTGLTFVTPFFEAKTAIEQSKKIGLPLRVENITHTYIDMLKRPKYGYGSNMNPCIDCHALMFRLAVKILEKEGFHFLFSGEVLGERPFSQTKQSLEIVARESGYKDLILRPLSAKLLDETIPEKRGWVDRSRLLGIQGRSRKPQMELARQFGISEYPSPAGGCRLTEPNFARRLRDLLNYDQDPPIRDVELLKYGRHLRLSESIKIIIGRNHFENQQILKFSQPEDIKLWVFEYPGPVVLICNRGDNDIQTILFAARAAVRYSDAPTDSPCTVIYTSGEGEYKLYPVIGCSDEDIKNYMIM